MYAVAFSPSIRVYQLEILLVNRCSSRIPMNYFVILDVIIKSVFLEMRTGGFENTVVV